LRWYDYWLKGKDTGIEKDPPVNIWIMGKNKWKAEYEWPIARTQYHDLYLRPAGRNRGLLHTEPPGRKEKELSYLSWPFSPGLVGIPQLVYRSPILSRECEVTGHIVLRLYASSNACDTSFFVRFCDEDETGVFRVLTKGWLKASHREIDESRSLPYRPFHPHTREQKLEAGRVYEFLIEIWPTSNLFHAGHRIRVDISCAESLYFDFPYSHFPSLQMGRVHIHSSPEYPSRITLPLIDSDPVFSNTGAGILFSDEPSGYFAIRGRKTRCGPGNEFPVA
jgi:predicted acyl esterase